MAALPPDTQARAGWTELISPALAPRTALVLLGIWLNAADGMVTATIMPSVVRDIGGYLWFGWAVAIYLTGSIVAGASAGQLARRMGLRRAVILAALTYAAGCALSAMAGGIGPFLAGRLAQGLGGGWVVGFCYVAISQLFAERLWARMFGAGAGVWGVASFLGPLVGGVFAQAGFWRGAFWMFAGQGLLLALIAPALLPLRAPDDAAARRPLAWRTLGVLTLAICAIAVADILPRVREAVLFLAAGLGLLTAAGRVNGAPGERLLPGQALRPATVAGAGYAMIFALSAASAVFGVYGAALLQTLDGLSPLAAGYVVALEAVGWTITAILVSGQPDRRHGRLIVAGAAAVAAGLAVLALFIGSRQLWGVALGSLVMGSGFGLAWSLVTRRILNALPPEEVAIGAAATPTTQLIGSAVGAAAAGAFANFLGLAHHFSAQAAALSAPWLFWAFVPLTLAGLAAAIRQGRAYGLGPG